jgi:hypothetical protein
MKEAFQTLKTGDMKPSSKPAVAKKACQECHCPTHKQKLPVPQMQAESDLVSWTQPLEPPPLPPVLPSPLPVPPEAQTPLPPLPLTFPSISELEGVNGPAALSQALGETSQIGPTEVMQQTAGTDVGAPSFLQSQSIAVHRSLSDSGGTCYCLCGRDHDRDRMDALLEAQRNAESERHEEGVQLETSLSDQVSPMELTRGNAPGFLQSVGRVPA